MTKEKSNRWAITAMVFAFLEPILGCIFGIIGMSKAEKSRGNGFGLSIAALIVSAVIFVVHVILGYCLLRPLLIKYIAGFIADAF